MINSIIYYKELYKLALIYSKTVSDDFCIYLIK